MRANAPNARSAKVAEDGVGEEAAVGWRLQAECRSLYVAMRDAAGMHDGQRRDHAGAEVKGHVRVERRAVGLAVQEPENVGRVPPHHNRLGAWRVAHHLDDAAVHGECPQDCHFTLQLQLAGLL